MLLRSEQGVFYSGLLLWQIPTQGPAVSLFLLFLISTDKHLGYMEAESGESEWKDGKLWFSTTSSNSFASFYAQWVILAKYILTFLIRFQKELTFVTLTTGIVGVRAYLLKPPRVNRRFSDLAEETSFCKVEVPNPGQIAGWKFYNLIASFISHSLISRGGICSAKKNELKERHGY